MTSEERKQTKKDAEELIKGEVKKLTPEQKNAVLYMLIGANMIGKREKCERGKLEKSAGSCPATDMRVSSLSR